MKQKIFSSCQKNDTTYSHLMSMFMQIEVSTFIGVRYGDVGVLSNTVRRDFFC